MLVNQPAANACTDIQLQTEDGAFASGRTLEFGISFDISIIVVPRNYEFTGQTTLGDGKKWKAKYASVGAILAGNEIILDGINEKGLSVGSFYFPGFPPEVQPFHFIVYDNPVGTMTNSPTFDWHMTNLRNYVALDPNNVPPVSIFGRTFKQLGQGSGMRGARWRYIL